MKRMMMQENVDAFFIKCKKIKEKLRMDIAELDREKMELKQEEKSIQNENNNGKVNEMDQHDGQDTIINEMN